jgi:hypothetical protein
MICHLATSTPRRFARRSAALGVAISVMCAFPAVACGQRIDGPQSPLAAAKAFLVALKAKDYVTAYGLADLVSQFRTSKTDALTEQHFAAFENADPVLDYSVTTTFAGATNVDARVTRARGVSNERFVVDGLIFDNRYHVVVPLQKLEVDIDGGYPPSLLIDDVPVAAPDFKVAGFCDPTMLVGCSRYLQAFVWGFGGTRKGGVSAGPASSAASANSVNSRIALAIMPSPEGTARADAVVRSYTGCKHSLRTMQFAAHNMLGPTSVGGLGHRPAGPDENLPKPGESGIEVDGPPGFLGSYSAWWVIFHADGSAAVSWTTC